MDLRKIFLRITVYIVAVSSVIIDTSPTISQAPYENTYDIHTTTSNSTQPLHLTDIETECKTTDPPFTTPLGPRSCTLATGTACRRVSHTSFSSLPRDQWTWIERPFF
ncbi:hypothetical protein N7G274_006935 [Stereocaulon virgatum]|uniref:Uncharacterized protein n=1 Tax=Stereocaulon virgatum TaxID=373712 RepID=A0ABR4A3I7_9LECA